MTNLQTTADLKNCKIKIVKFWHSWKKHSPLTFAKSILVLFVC